ncbi:MAG: HAD-IA family hydrolase [Pseudomonadales bacterium]|nr:HAD-IA family hydrolase [Pseudomonadales bacterium]
MGVIFKSADDVAELLVPFISENVDAPEDEIIQSAYIEASLGNISPDEFWSQVNMPRELEDDYLSLHSLNAGVFELLAFARASKIPVWCLSNDVGRWSSKLRNNLGIEGYLAGSVISGDVDVRKPDRKIYELFIERSGYEARDLLFLDDREKNVIAAREIGIESILFEPEKGFKQAIDWLSERAH